MPKYTAQLTVLVDFIAKNEEDAEYFLRKMDYAFIHPIDGFRLDSEIIDKKIKKMKSYDT